MPLPIAAIGAIISAVAGLAQSAYGGYKAGKERRKMDQYLTQREADNKAWYNANALGDYTNRGDVQNLIRNLRENLGRKNKSLENTAVITGATPEALAAAKEQANKVISDTYSNIGAVGQQYKDRVTNQYLALKNSLDQIRYGNYGQSAQSYENLMSNGLNTTATSLSSLFKSLQKSSSGGGTGGAGGITGGGSDNGSGGSDYIDDIYTPKSKE
ncbi:MAG: hypothetical protein LBM08_05025 [Dysgonamonadaceae bacterium]|jgi:hypothetical protein|nr:hypothetical protein [Dysgonamonadaceae bacterium]